jgi:subtilase family serine protease
MPLLLVAAVLAVLVTGAGSASSDPGGQPHRDNGKGHWFEQTCASAPDGYASCDAQIVTDSAGAPLASANPPASALGPAQFAGAYGLQGASSTATVGIVDAYDDPNIESDLGVFSTQYSLPACTTANLCFKKVDQNGGTRYPAPNSGWALEIALDVETVHGICPGCKILLVEASSNSFADLGAAENEAVALGANVVSNSWGGSEGSGETSLDSYFNHPGRVITFSSGDNGFGVEYPASSPYVVAVGGTTLSVNTNGPGNYSWGGETAWGGSGSGCSKYEPKPGLQKDSGCSKRTVVDVSADADPDSGAAVYATYGSTAWVQVGGTSLASPLIAAVYALSGNTSNGSAPYGNSGALHDVTSGSNGSCSPTYLCTAGTGYDGPTGLGTPNGLAAFNSSAPPPPTADYTLAVSPSSQTVTAGGSTTYTASITPNAGFGSASVSVSVSGAPNSVAPCTLTVTKTSCTLSVTTSASTQPNPYSLTFNFTGTGAPSYSTPATLVVQPGPPGDFSLAISPTSRSIKTPATTTFTVTITRVNNFTGAVMLSVSGLPPGSSSGFAQNPVTGTSTTVTITVPRNRGSYTITVTGTSGALTHSKTASLSLR